MMVLPLLNDAVREVNVRLPRPSDDGLPWFDHTTLKSINECPTWGMVRHVKSLRIPGGGRAMALEAGAAAHEFYAAVRLYDLRKTHVDHFDCLGPKLFADKTWDNMRAHLGQDEDDHTTGLNFCLQALYDSGFYDDPHDKRRTMTNIEEGCIAYYGRWPWGRHPIYIQDEDDPNCFVGIEIGMEFVIEFVLNQALSLGLEKITYRYRGRIDGLHRAHGGPLQVQENKTAWRLDDAWCQSFIMSHQITGYCVGASLLTGEECNKAVVKGMAIPLPRSYDYGGLVDEAVSRPRYLVAQFLQWVWDTTRVYEQFKDDVDQSTRFTHSCNRFFRPCSMLPYCGSDDEERATILSEMEYVQWNPLDDKAKD